MLGSGRLIRRCETSVTAATRKPKPAPVQPTRQPAKAYDDDFYGWTIEQAAALRAGHLSALDRDNLAEEIESLGRSELSSLVSAWRVVLLHMLKFDHQPSGAPEAGLSRFAISAIRQPMFSPTALA